jgi:hypothetical protein
VCEDVDIQARILTHGWYGAFEMFYYSIQEPSDEAKILYRDATTTDKGGSILIVLFSMGLGEPKEG